MTVKFTFYDKDESPLKSFQVDKNQMYNRILKMPKSILDIALDNDIDIKYGCMGGSCSACICEVIDGAEHINKEGLRKQVFKGVEEKQLLTCISSVREDAPDGAEIKIKKLV